MKLVAFLKHLEQIVQVTAVKSLQVTWDILCKMLLSYNKILQVFQSNLESASEAMLSFSLSQALDTILFYLIVPDKYLSLCYSNWLKRRIAGEAESAKGWGG